MWKIHIFLCRPLVSESARVFFQILMNVCTHANLQGKWVINPSGLQSHVFISFIIDYWFIKTISMFFPHYSRESFITRLCLHWCGLAAHACALWWTPKAMSCKKKNTAPNVFFLWIIHTIRLLRGMTIKHWNVVSSALVREFLWPDDTFSCL